MSKDVNSGDILNLSVIYENDEEILDQGRVYHFYKYGESIEDTAMKVKLQLAQYRQILDCLNQHSSEYHTVRCRLSKINKRKTIEQSKIKCHVCNIPINLENSSDFVTCGSCNQSPICRNLHCAIWSEKTKVWNCKLCRSFLNGSNSACDWLISQLNDKLLQGKSFDSHSKIVWDQSNTNDNAPLIPLEQREKVREFVEELVSTLIGGSIDNAPVGQLCENKECLPTGENEPDSIDESHTNLRVLVQRIIEEVFKIPDFFDHSGVASQPQRTNLPQFDPKKYEELLATAVLNKLVESYSYERRFENSSGIHSGSDVESNIHATLGKAQLETISISSSNEPRSESSNSVSLNDQPMSLTATKYIHLSHENSINSPIDSPPQSPRSVGSDEEAYLSDYIQKHKVPLPGIDAHDSDSVDEDFQSVNSNDTDGNWQENWLFKKRKLKNETAAVIGMLVPSPMEDVKALIGDKTTDEVSDLSEAGSDLDDEENEPVNGSADLPHALIESKTIIGGKNEFGSFNEVKTIDELLQPDSLVSTQSIDNQSPVIMEAKNDLILMSDSDSKPIVLHAREKTAQSSKIESNNDIKVNENGGNKTIISDSEAITKDIPLARSNVFDGDNGEPPVPTPRKKSKSLESVKKAASIEVPTEPTIQESNSLPVNITVVPQVVDLFDVNMRVDDLLTNKFETQTLNDELLDSSINDIYESIDDDTANEYQSLVAEDETVMKGIEIISPSSQLISNAANPFIEDCLNETTQEISQEQLANNRIESLSFEQPISGTSSNISNENYICKVLPTEFDLSVDSVYQSKPSILEVVPQSIEDKSIPQGVYISSKPALIAVEIASHESVETVQEFTDSLETNEQPGSIPTLIISKICCDTPPPTVANDDNVSLKTKKVLKAQDSLELPKDDRDKFTPAKRVDSFEMDDADKISDAKSSSDDAVNSVADSVKNNTEESANVENAGKDDEDDFILVTEEEVNALKIEEQESIRKSEEQAALTDSLAKTESENLLVPEVETVDDKKQKENFSQRKIDQTNDIQVTTSVVEAKKLSSSQSFEIGEIVDSKKSQNYTSVLELSSPTESHTATVISSVKTFELATTKTKDSAPLLPSIKELTTQVDTTRNSSISNTTSKLFTSNQAIVLDPVTNLTHLNEHGPLPGSIAEREHLKWMNAQDIPNNPYSAEALQRRLSQTKNPSKVIDITRYHSIDESSTKPEVENGKPLQIILGAGEPDHLRYGRDYYINDSKTASGTRKKTSSIQRYSSTDEDNISSKATTPDCDVFTAKIVQIRDDPDHTSDESAKLKLSIDRVSDNSSLSLQSDSLLSDDSETRIYDLRKSETAYLRSDIIRTSRIPVGATVTPPSTPIDGESVHKNLDQFFAIKQLNELKKSEEEQDAISQKKSQTPFNTGRGVSKPLSPETLKFFAPKPKPVFTSKIKMEEVGSIKPLILEREEKVVPQNGTIEKAVIEEDVISSLPSVKALAKNFIEPPSEASKQPIQRPKSFVWQVSKENGNSTNGSSKEPSADSYIPPYESRYHPVAPGHSITARSLSTKFREELKHSISDDTSISTDNIEIVERDHSPDRPPSPVLLKGIFKEKMSFFQNLETK